jgi:hypothetical protein
MARRGYDRRNRVRTLARELADSGQYANWQEIEKALLSAGFTEAPQFLSYHFVRRSLDARCAAALRSP